MTKQYFGFSLFVFAVAMTLSSCEKTATHIQLPESESKLVIGCFISPQDTVISASVTKSNPIFGINHNNGAGNNSLVTNAMVTISNGNNTQNLTYNLQHAKYEIATTYFPIVAGKSYYLEVSAPGLESVSSSCTVPTANISVADMEIKNGAGNNTMEIKWQDIPNEINFYRVVTQYVLTDSSTMVKDTAYVTFGDHKTIYSDVNKDGKGMLAQINYISLIGSPYSLGQIPPSTYKICAYDLYLLNTDINYYTYFKSLENYTGGGDPFSEPSLIYTNIKDGLGCFGAYQKFFDRKK